MIHLQISSRQWLRRGVANCRLLASHVLVVGMSGVNVEAAKDMALAGNRRH